mmetsp:Transcript_16939/g.54296  ORF Transcript_16939/g.54296 Transcript_16939/m.54296 type:complete len:228 (+) Transcript_16939:459-1142(+)
MRWRASCGPSSRPSSCACCPSAWPRSSERRGHRARCWWMWRQRLRRSWAWSRSRRQRRRRARRAVALARGRTATRTRAIWRSAGRQAQAATRRRKRRRRTRRPRKRGHARPRPAAQRSGDVTALRQRPPAAPRRRLQRRPCKRCARCATRWRPLRWPACSSASATTWSTPLWTSRDSTRSCGRSCRSSASQPCLVGQRSNATTCSTWWCPPLGAWHGQRARTRCGSR